jgi:hypothetical protein
MPSGEPGCPSSQKPRSTNIADSVRWMRGSALRGRLASSCRHRLRMADRDVSTARRFRIADVEHVLAVHMV